MSDDLRVIRPVSNSANRVRGDGSDDQTSQAIHDQQVHELRLNAGQGSAINARATNLTTTGAQKIGTGTGSASTSSSAATGTTAAPNDNFATVSASAWEKFMADMLGALDVALDAEGAAKDGKIDSTEWNNVFSGATKDGQLSLLDISAMYAGLQDMHDKGSLDDSQYKDAVGSLEHELTSRYSGTSSTGLDNLARLYINHLEGLDGAGGDVTAVTNNPQGAKNLNTQRDLNDQPVANDPVQQQDARPIDDEENDNLQRARLQARRTDVNDTLASTLTDIGINRQVADVNEGRGTHL